MKNKRTKLDLNTRHYIKRMRLLQFAVFALLAVLFVMLARSVATNNKSGFREVALAEVEESMQETVNNIVIHIEMTRVRMAEEAATYMMNLESHLCEGEISRANDILFETAVCEESKLEQTLQIFYTDVEGKIYYINAANRMINSVEHTAKQEMLAQAVVRREFEVNGQNIVLFVNQKDIDVLVKEEIHDYIHAQQYQGNQYVWVNEIFNMEGGNNYAIRRIHPNLVEAEGEYLSTAMQDVAGNYPYLTELQGIKSEGKVFQSYYFKNKVNDEITEKFSYSQYYEPYKWIISTGETLEEVYDYASRLNERNVQQIIKLMVIFIIVLVIMFTMMTNILEKQAHTYRGRLMKQAEVLEDIYTTMSVGLIRLRMQGEKSTVITLNPKALELFGVNSEEEFILRRYNSVVDTVIEEDAEKLMCVCEELKEQWDNIVVECRVRWKDGTIHLLRIRNMLVEFDGTAKIIQRMCQDITEERRQQEEALHKAEEKASLDPMTQIKNKKAIEMITRERIREAADKKLPIAVGFVDIDNFRDYNTKYGHLQGDEVIKYVAATLKHSVKGDVGRTGGDEFTFCILDATYETVEAAMKEMHKKLNVGTVLLETGEMIPTPCSIGVVIEQGTSLEYETILKDSDEAMYQAKERGKNTYQILVK